MSPSIPAPTVTSPTRSLPWRPLLLLAFAAFWTVTLEMLPAGLLPRMSEDLGVRPSRIGLLVTVWAMTVGLTSLPLTWVFRRWARTTVLSVAMGSLGVSTVVMALAPGYEQVLVARLVAAAGHGVFWSVLMVYAASIAPTGRQARAIAVVNTGPLLASATGLPLGTFLGSVVGWRFVVGAAGLAIVGGALVMKAFLPAGDEAGVRSHPDRRDSTARRVVAAAALGAAALFAHFLVFTFVAVVATQHWGFAEGAVSALLLAFGAAGAVGLAAAGWLGDRSPQSALAATILSLAATFTVLAVPGVPRAAVLVAVVTWGLLLGMLPPLLQNAVIGAASPPFRAAAGAVLVATFNLGVASGAAAGGVVIDLLGIGALLPLAAVVAVLSALGVAGMHPKRTSVPVRQEFGSLR